MDNKQRLSGVVVVFAILALLPACASSSGRGWQNKRPQLYPNAHYREVGPETAQYDVAQCMSQADYGAPQRDTTKDAAVNTVGGAAGGAALGAIAGAISGNAGTGAATGAAVGATAGVGKTIYDSRKPSESYQGYVEACLRERGYEVIGWQ
jgi:outer membrane lipoprotein SlyB